MSASLRGELAELRVAQTLASAHLAKAVASVAVAACITSDGDLARAAELLDHVDVENVAAHIAAQAIREVACARG